LALKPSQLRPTDVRQALERIAKSAAALSDDLHTLMSAAQSRAPADGAHSAYVAQLVTFLGIAVAPIERDDQGSPFSLAGTGAAVVSLQDFDRRLAGAVAAAELLARGGLDPALLARKKSGEDPALPAFVGLLADVWRSLTGREPSTRKVQKARGEEPDFVLFVQSVARLVAEKHAGRVKPPTIDTIAGALKGTRIPSEK
jgi:hypothetical protein